MDCPESFSHTRDKGNYSWPLTSPATKAEVSCRKNPLQSAQRSWWVMRSSHFGSFMGNRRERRALCDGEPDGSLSWHPAVPCREDAKYTGPVQHGLQEKGVLHHFHHLQQVQASRVGSWLSAWAGRGNRCTVAFCAIRSWHSALQYLQMHFKLLRHLGSAPTLLNEC